MIEIHVLVHVIRQSYERVWSLTGLANLDSVSSGLGFSRNLVILNIENGDSQGKVVIESCFILQQTDNFFKLS